MLKIYMFQSCPYCEKVRRAFAEMGIQFEEINADHGTSGHHELVRIGGKSQVPFLVDEARGVQMYESDDIIEYGKEHYNS